MKNQEVEGRQLCAPIHGDLLEEVFAHVPLIDLACASLVSKTWQFSVLSSLSFVNKVKPWLIVQTQKTSTRKIRTHAYDPRSNLWVEICHLPNPTKKISPLQSLGSSLFYELSHEGLSFSMDPLHLKWHHIPPPSTWRVDPIVAIVGSNVVVAGGGSSLWEDDPLTVEMYDMETSHWSTCQSMPSILKDTAASSWVSVASNQGNMFVTEKASCVTFSFSLENKSWAGPYNLRPNPNVYFSAIGFAGENLILAGLIGDEENVASLKLWEIDLENMECDEIGEIPIDLLEKLKGENSYILSSITLLTTTNFIYMYNTSDPSEIIFCELIEGICKWGHVKNLVLDDDSRIGESMVMSCGTVDIANLHLAIGTEKLKFVPK